MEQLMDQQLNDDSAHYEISLTAGQAFVAFVLLLLSLAASFAFGIMVGKAPGEGIPLAKALTPGVSEVATVDIEDPVPAIQPAASRSAPEPVSRQAETAVDDFVIETVRESPPTAGAGEAGAPVATPSTDPVPHYAQLASTGEAKTAEALAARLINDGFTSAYVERNQTDSGMIHRVRVRFGSEAEARAAVPKLSAYTTETIWVTKFTG